MRRFFAIADTHFGHENIIKYCNRPFRDVEEMDKVLIKNWNETVSNDDVVLMLGDFAFGKDKIEEYTPKLHGKKILIKGNHDHASDDFYRRCGFAEVSKYPILFADFYLLSHAPLILSETTPYMNLYGHIHGDTRYQDTSTSKCFSVERIGYRPALVFTKD